MPRRHHHEYLDIYCCLSREFLLAHPMMTKRKYQNRNALERTLSSRRSKYANAVYPSERKRIKQIMSKQQLSRSDEYDQSLQMADGDKKMKNVIDSVLDHLQQQRNHHRSKKQSKSSTSRKYQTDNLESHYKSKQDQRQYPLMLSPLVKQTTKTNSSRSHSSVSQTDEDEHFNVSIASLRSSNSVGQGNRNFWITIGSIDFVFE